MVVEEKVVVVVVEVQHLVLVLVMVQDMGLEVVKDMVGQKGMVEEEVVAEVAVVVVVVVGGLLLVVGTVQDMVQVVGQVTGLVV